MDVLYEHFLQLADKMKEVGDDELETLASQYTATA